MNPHNYTHMCPHNSKHGFRPKRITITALKKLKDIVKMLLLEYQYCALASIDMEGAFDLVSWEILNMIIDELPIEDYLKSILKCYNSQRLTGFVFSSGIEWFELIRVCPQGSCLGSLLWQISC